MVGQRLLNLGICLIALSSSSIYGVTASSEEAGSVEWTEEELVATMDEAARRKIFGDRKDVDEKEEKVFQKASGMASKFFKREFEASKKKCAGKGEEESMCIFQTLEKSLYKNGERQGADGENPLLGGGGMFGDLKGDGDGEEDDDADLTGSRRGMSKEEQEGLISPDEKAKRKKRIKEGKRLIRLDGFDLGDKDLSANVTLADIVPLKGRAVIFSVNQLFTGSACSEGSMPGFVRDLEAYERNNVTLVAVGTEKPAVMRAWHQRHKAKSIKMVADTNTDLSFIMDAMSEEDTAKNQKLAQDMWLASKEEKKKEENEKNRDPDVNGVLQDIIAFGAKREEERKAREMRLATEPAVERTSRSLEEIEAEVREERALAKAQKVDEDKQEVQECRLPKQIAFIALVEDFTVTHMVKHDALSSAEECKGHSADFLSEMRTKGFGWD